MVWRVKLMLSICGSEAEGIQASEKLVAVMSVGVRKAEEEAICPLRS